VGKHAAKPSHFLFQEEDNGCFLGGNFGYELEGPGVVIEVGQFFIAWQYVYGSMASSRLIKGKDSILNGCWLMSYHSQNRPRISNIRRERVSPPRVPMTTPYSIASSIRLLSKTSNPP
jgi:hypothetical protein